MSENTINELLEYYSNLNNENKNSTDVITSKDVEGSYDSIEEIGRIVFDSEEIQKRRRINIGSIYEKACKLFFPKKPAGGKVNVDADWMARFIECAKDVSDEDMRLLWAKVLSGEMGKPNSISVMTLETLRNMSKHDAEIFHKFANFTVVSDGDTFIPNIGAYTQDNWKPDIEYGISCDELLWMQELGLINFNNGLEVLLEPNDRNSKVERTLKCGNLIIKISSSKRLSIPCYSYTRVGAQLHSLIEDITPNKDFFEERIKNKYSSESTKIDIY